jgi:hypothetical protein
MNNSTKHKTFIIVAFIAFGIVVVLEILMSVNALIDGKYYLTESTYHLHINCLGIALLVSDLVIFVLLVLVAKKPKANS